MNKPKMAECPSCDGYGDHGTDEEGRVYSCFSCGCTGWVTAESAAETRKEQAEWDTLNPAPAPREYVKESRPVALPAWCINNDIPF